MALTHHHSALNCEQHHAASAEHKCRRFCRQHLRRPAVANHPAQSQSIILTEQRGDGGMMSSSSPCATSLHQVDQLGVEMCMIWNTIEQNVLQTSQNLLCPLWQQASTWQHQSARLGRGSDACTVTFQLSEPSCWMHGCHITSTIVTTMML